MSIKLKLIAALMVAGLAAALLGLSALMTTSSMGDLAVTLYDKPLQAINYARSAQTAFALLELDDRDSGDEVGEEEMARFVARAREVESDLRVVERRGISAAIKPLVGETRAQIVKWREAAVDARRASSPAAGSQSGVPADAIEVTRDRLALDIRRNLETLTQMAADDGYQFREEAVELIGQAKLQTMIAIGIALVACIVTALLLARNIVGPVDAMAGAMINLAGGSREQTVPHLGRRDEIGGMASALEVFKTAMLEVSEAKDRAEAATRAKSEFLAMMSHEIRTPMSGILGMTRLLLGSELERDQRGQAQTVLDSGQALLTILNDILDYSKLEAGKFDVDCIDFDLRRLIDGVAALLESRAAEKGLGFQTSVDPSLPHYLQGDPGRIRQILLNLTGNAIKFTEIGLVALRVRPLARDDGRIGIRFEIVDTGIGLAPEAKEKLFGSFSQADSSISRRFGGTGLGLAISKRLVSLMDGTIGVESEVGRGSTFWMELSFAEGVKPVEETPANLAATRLRPLTILLAEDNKVNQKVAVGLLKPGGHRVDVVETGEAAVAAVAGGTAYDVVLMDVHMPVLDGMAAARLIRALPGPESRVPIIAATAGATAEEVQRCLDSGMNDYVPKPINPDQLVQALMRTLGIEGTVRDTPSPAPDIGQRLAEGDEELDEAVIALLESQLGEEIVRELVEEFRQGAGDLTARIVRARASGDLTLLGDAAHTLKSAAGSLGLKRLFRVLAAVEEEARAGDPAAIDAASPVADLVSDGLARLDARNVSLATA